MAVTFSLTSTGLTTIDFTSATNFTLIDTQYTPIVVTPTGDGSIPPYVTEIVPVMIREPSADYLANQMHYLADLQKRAAEYWVDQQQAVPVWLNCKLDGETTGRQALVKAIHFEWLPRIHPIYRECAIGPDWLVATVLIERHPYWERTATRTFPNATPAAAASVAYDYTATADIVGDVPARVNAFGLRCGTAAITMDRFWLGIRSVGKHGATAISGFVPVWEAEDGTNADAEVADDGGGTEPNTASPGGGSGDYITVTPVGGGTDWDDGDFHGVAHIDATDVGYTAGLDELGRFLWLMRAKVSAGEWQVRLRMGYFTAKNFYDPVLVDGTSWDYYEVANAAVPGRNMQALDIAHVTADAELLTAIFIEAKRTSGAGTLSIDCFCSIPIDEGFLKIWGGTLTNTTDMVFGQGPNEADQTIWGTAASGFTYDVVAFENENFRLPPGDGRIYCVYARVGSSVFTDQLEFGESAASNATPAYTERWTGLRGAE